MKTQPAALPNPAQTATPDARPARTTQRGLARREKILNTATAIFLERGYADVSVVEIIKTVGGSKTNVYSQFGNKEGLFVAVVDTLCADFLRDFTQLALSGMKPAQGLKHIGNNLLSVLLEARHIAFQRLIIAESGRFPALGRVWFAAGPQQSRHLMAAFIASKQQEGSLRAIDPLQAATLLHDMLVSNPLYLALLGQTSTPQETRLHVDRVVDLFLLGCGAHS